LFEGCTAKRLTDEFHEKSWRKHGVNKLFKKLQDTGTVDRRPGSAADSAVSAPKKTLRFFFRSSRSLPLTSFYRFSGEATENTFSSVKKTKSVAILRELLKQKLNALHASSVVRVCQLLCTAPLETFQMQVLTNNPGQRRPKNTRLP